MSDDLSSAISEASQSLNREQQRQAPGHRHRRRLPAAWRSLVALLVLLLCWVFYGEQALKKSGLIGRSEVQLGVNEVLARVADSVNAYYRREGVLPAAPPHSYLAYAIDYQTTGITEYTLTYTLGGEAITHTYRAE